jgi:hypothetical protein
MRFFLFSIILLTGFSAIAQNQVFKPALIQKAVYFDVSPPLRNMIDLKNVKVDVTWKDGVIKNNFNNKQDQQNIQPKDMSEGYIQTHFGQILSDTTIQNFDGLNGGSYIPPDTDGDVGPNHYFQVVNCSFAIYNKSGQKLLGPLASSSVWSGMPNNSNSGDAVVLYDENANRWIFSQFSLPYYPNGPFFQMIAISQTPDPTGSWYRYQYLFTAMPDYPKFGVWPDGYYMSCNRFAAGSGGFAGTGAVAYDRTLMLAGNPDAQMIYFTLPSSNDAYSMMPSDCDGEFPPMGTPNYFVYERESPTYHLGILEFHADWATPANSTLGNLLSLPVDNFSSNIGYGVPQLGTNVKLATLSDRLMYRIQFRKFSDHWSMVTNHSVNAGSNIAGIRWYEVRKTTGDWSVYQQATYAPSDNLSRWMGSMAMDADGNIALGYSVSSSTMYPSIRYTGRMSTDPLNQMTMDERGIINGGGSQTDNSRRWGDYSSMAVDPYSPNTFWYTQEYYSSTSASSWKTRIGSFSFGNIFSSYATSTPVTSCAGDSVQLNAVAYGGSGNYSYVWSSIPPGFLSTQMNPKVAPLFMTTYIVAVSDGNQIQHDTTIVSTIPPATCFAGNDTTVCSYLPSIDLHATASSYLIAGWSSSGDGSFSNLNDLNTTYTFGHHDYLVDSVNFTLITIPLSPCVIRPTSKKHVTLDACTGVQESASENLSIFLQPNPARESVRVIISGKLNETGILTMTNLTGQTLFSENVLPSSAIQKLDLNKYPSGIYFITLKTDKKIITKKLMVY